MIIKEINISSFGGLKNKKLELDNRMNIIYGENESGKSTILLFIKFMLYGLGRKSASNDERERSISWDEHMAAGSMTFDCNGISYRIERRYSDATRGGSEKVSIICLDNGEEVITDKEPGEYFFGVPKEVFESSACVGQMGASDINGEKTANSIQNLLSSADESVDTSKILKTLDNIRISYRHKNGNGGSLYDTEQQIIFKKQRLDKAKEDAVLLEEQSQRLETAMRDYEIAKRDFEASDTLLSEFNKISIIKRFDDCEAREEELLVLGEQRREYVRETLNTEFFPTNQHLAELRHSTGRYEIANKRLFEKKLELDKSVSSYDENAATFGEKIEKNGGADSVLATVRELKKQLKKQTGVVVAISSAGILASAAAIPFIILQQLWGFAFLAFLALVPTAFIISAKKKKSIKNKIDAVAAEYGASSDKLFERLEYCLKQLADKRAYESKNATLQAEYTQAEKDKNDAEYELCRLIDKTNPELPLDKANEEYCRIEEFINSYDTMFKEEETLRRVVIMEKKALEQYDCEKLKSEITTDISALTPTALASAERSRSFLQQKKNILEHKISGLRENVIQLRANATDPLPIADEVAELEKKKSEDSEFYESLTLAISAITQAGAAISGNVMPAITAQAGEYMGRISENKYVSVRTTSNLKQLSLDKDGYGIKSEFLSGGTKDALYLSLRFALFERIFAANRPPLILDEAMCQLDEGRAQNTLRLVNEMSERNIQSLIFTSHKREEQICDSVNVKYNLIKLS